MLQRLNMIPYNAQWETPNHQLIPILDEETRNNNTLLTGTGDPIGQMSLQGWDVATITMDFRKNAANLTYAKHYQISIYVDCLPCPPRYRCDYSLIPPDCTQPSFTFQTEIGIYCKTDLVAREDEGPGCCECQPHSMPSFFDEDMLPTYCSVENPPNGAIVPAKCPPNYDNKHSMLQINLLALRDVKVQWNPLYCRRKCIAERPLSLSLLFFFSHAPTALL